MTIIQIESVLSYFAEAGIIGFPKPNYVFKENDVVAMIPVHRTVGMDGKVQASWFTRDMTAIAGTHYEKGRGVVTFDDGEVINLFLKLFFIRFQDLHLKL